MQIPQRFIDQFGSEDRVPEYIRRHFANRALRLVRQEEAIQKAKERKRLEREAVKALRRPPARVWRVGNVMFWEPPDTVDELEPAGYWISEVRHNQWTKHGDYLLPHFRSAQLFGDGAARVEAYYHNTALGEVYATHSVRATPGEDPYLVNKVRYYVSVGGRPDHYYERWRRVLAGFGVARGKSVRGVMVEPLAPAMTAREAQVYANRGWVRWVPVAAALRRIEEVRR